MFHENAQGGREKCNQAAGGGLGNRTKLLFPFLILPFGAHMWLQLTGEKNLYLSPSSRGEQTEMKQFPAADLGLCLSNLSESRS